MSQADGLNLLLDEDVGGRRIPSAVATAPGILSESITLVLAAPSARPTGMCRPSDGRAIGLLPMPNHKTPRAHAIKLSALKADPENCRLHTTRNLAMITASLNDVGPARSIVIDERGVVLAGEGVRRAAITAGIHTVEVVEASGDRLVAVRRRDLSANQKRALALYDNRTSDLSEWDGDRIRSLLEAGEDLTRFFDDDEQRLFLCPDDAPDVEPITEDVAEGVRVVTCPACGHQFPP